MTSPPAARPMARHGAGRFAPRGRGHALAHLLRSALADARRSIGGRCAVCRGWCEGGLCVPCDRRFAFARPRCSGCAMPFASRPIPSHDIDDPVVDNGDNGDNDNDNEDIDADADKARAAARRPLRCLRCRIAPPAWSRATAGVDYGYPWDRLLADFKFHQRLDHIDVLLAPLLERLRNGATDDGVPGTLRVVPVPLSRDRLRERGYNQSWELARRVARTLTLDARADALFRVRDTGHQLGLRRDARGANLRGAFVVEPRHAAWVRGAAIALVDDVLTTGATAQSAASALLAAGARDVQLWVVARTPD